MLHMIRNAYKHILLPWGLRDIGPHADQLYRNRQLWRDHTHREHPRSASRIRLARSLMGLRSRWPSLHQHPWCSLQFVAGAAFSRRAKWTELRMVLNRMS